ncbi:MAG: rhomboid family intramembrane serine protease [Prevotellaceae bacterium]|jgi:membrane associated rhomboid family serine protease|nr:rhomboid family intramembrane serine protease [Prevotellaceae bacterium]
MTITIALVAATVLASITALNQRTIFDKLMLSPYRMVYHKEWYRIITHGFIHADYIHLAVNMVVLYSFGSAVEMWLDALHMAGTTSLPMLHYAVLYFGGMVIATISTIAKYKDTYDYSAVGASGAVSAVLFSFIFFQPWSRLYLMGIIPIPGIIFGPLYLWYSSYMGRRAADNVNHDAHFYGAIFGFLYPIAIDPQLLMNFIHQLLMR